MHASVCWFLHRSSGVEMTIASVASSNGRSGSSHKTSYPVIEVVLARSYTLVTLYLLLLLIRYFPINCQIGGSSSSRVLNLIAALMGGDGLLRSRV